MKQLLDDPRWTEEDRILAGYFTRRTEHFSQLTRARTRVAVIWTVSETSSPEGRNFIVDVALGRLTWDPKAPRCVRVADDHKLLEVEIPTGAIREILEWRGPEPTLGAAS